LWRSSNNVVHQVDILLKCGKHLYESNILLRREAYASKTSLTPHASSKRSCMCVLMYQFCLFLQFFDWILELFRQWGIFLHINNWKQTYSARRVWRYQRVVTRICIAKKNREHNGQKKKYKRTNNDLQNIHIKLKIVTYIFFYFLFVIHLFSLLILELICIIVSQSSYGFSKIFYPKTNCPRRW
jgi:hypothetical protein